MSATAYTTLIEAQELAAQLSDPNVAVIDCRFELLKPDWGAQAYAESHIPGALFAHMERDLSDPVTPQSGRHPLPDPDRFAQILSDWGIDDSVQIIAYDQSNGAGAARLWWLARWLGHTRVAVLNGGFAAWQAAGLPVTSEPGTRARRNFIARRQSAAVLTTQDVLQRLRDPEMCLVDARGADRFAGENETIDPVAGHIPGARNHPFTRNVDSSGRFLPAEELRKRWLQTLDGQAPQNVVAMCGSGITACHNLLALEHAGLHGGRLYSGSWSEWIRDPQRPITR